LLLTVAAIDRKSRALSHSRLSDGVRLILSVIVECTPSCGATSTIARVASRDLSLDLSSEGAARYPFHACRETRGAQIYNNLHPVHTTRYIQFSPPRFKEFWH
jgi:hypothetical protein